MKIIWDCIISPFLLPKRSKRKLKRKPIPRRGAFKVRDNALKSYRQRYPNERLRQWAQEKRAGQLGREGQPIWPGEIAFKRILDNLKVYYACQFIIYRTGSFILLDFFVPSRKVAFELDGTTHAQQREYDAGRDKWLLE